MLPKPSSLADWPEIYRNLELPSLSDMHQRAVLAIGTGYEEWARDAFLIRAVMEQVMFRASDAFNQESKEKRRAEKKAAKQPTHPPPRKRHTAKGEAETLGPVSASVSKTITCKVKDST